MTAQAVRSDPEIGVWKALANPLRRHLIELLATRPHTTGELATAIPDLSRYAVMQHLGVLTDAGLVIVRRRGRHRVNHLDPVPLRRWYDQLVVPIADAAATEMLALERHVKEKGDPDMPTEIDDLRTIRIVTELRFATTPERLFKALTEETTEWFPATYGQERTEAVVTERFVGGRHYEDWGDGAGYLYGHVTVWDPPHRFATRGRVMAGSILDSEYELSVDGAETVLAMTKVAVGPMTLAEADSIRTYGDLGRFEAAIRAVVEDVD